MYLLRKTYLYINYCMECFFVDSSSSFLFIVTHRQNRRRTCLHYRRDESNNSLPEDTNSRNFQRYIIFVMLCLSIEFTGNESSKYNAVALYSITSIWYYQRTLKRMISNDGDPHCVLCHIIIIPPPYNTPFFNTHKERQQPERTEEKKKKREKRWPFLYFVRYLVPVQ